MKNSAIIDLWGNRQFIGALSERWLVGIEDVGVDNSKSLCLQHVYSRLEFALQKTKPRLLGQKKMPATISPQK
jgi:hypothetical protein